MRATGIKIDEQIAINSYKQVVQLSCLQTEVNALIRAIDYEAEPKFLIDTIGVLAEFCEYNEIPKPESWKIGPPKKTPGPANFQSASRY